MHIAFLGTRGFPDVQGGVERHCEHLAVNLVKLGCKVTVFTRRPYVDPKRKEYKGVLLTDLPAVRQKSLEALLHTFLGILRCIRLRPDILHIHGIGPGLFIPLARLFRLKVVLTTHGSNYMHQKWNKAEKAFLRLCEWVSIKTANRIIAVSDGIAREIEGRYGRKAVSIPNGVQLPESDGSGDTLARYGLEKGRYILAVGRLVPEKGFHTLVEAFRSVAADGWKLVIAGAADHASQYAGELLESMAKEERIAYAGFVTGKPLFELYDNAGLYVLPSSYEGMPISLLEAMSYGLYCIASDIEANRSLGLPEDRFFRPGDREELAGLLNRVIGSGVNTRMEREQIDCLLREYDWSVIAQRTLSVYQSCQKARTSPSAGMDTRLSS